MVKHVIDLFSFVSYLLYAQWRLRGYACAIGCVDGRCFEPVIRYFRRNHHVKWVDFRTKAGVSKLLAGETGMQTINNIMEDVIVSHRNHKSKLLAIVGHSKCAGNPTDREEQIEQLRRAKKTVDFFELEVRIILLFVDVDRKVVEEISPESTDRVEQRQKITN